MKSEDNVQVNPFEYRINDHLLYTQNHEISLTSSLPNQDMQRSLNLKFQRTNKHSQEHSDPQKHQHKKSEQNDMIVDIKFKPITQQEGNSTFIANDRQQKNQKWLQYLKNKQLQEQQVDMKERQEEVERRIKQYEFEHRMLKCYYWFKYMIPVILILIPVLLLVTRKH
ncbi:hypothetical protein pb186bvf_007463 [Paramecium bursaria]